VNGPGLGRPPRPRLRAVPGNIVDEEDEARRMKADVERLIREMVKRAGQEEIEVSGLLGSFDMKDPRVLEMVATQSILVSKAVPATVATEIRRALAVAIESGYDTDQMRKAVRATFRSARADWKLDRIARTESHQAHEGGGYQALRQNGVRRKEWIAAKDDKVRQDHRSDHVHMDGMVKELDDPFVDHISGAQLMYPGDVANAVSGADVINCRCVKVANFSDLEEQMFHRAVDPGAVWRLKAATQRKFEAAFTTAVKKFLKGMEERAIEELNRQVGEQRGVSISVSNNTITGYSGHGIEVSR